MKGSRTKQAEPVAVGLIDVRLAGDELEHCQDEIRSLAKRFGFALAPKIISVDKTSANPINDLITEIDRAGATAAIMPNADHVGGNSGVLPVMIAVLATNPKRTMSRAVFYTDDTNGSR